MQIASAVGTCHQPGCILAPPGGNSQDYKEGPSHLLAAPSRCPLGSSSILKQELVVLMVHKVPPAPHSLPTWLSVAPTGLAPESGSQPSAFLFVPPLGCFSLHKPGRATEDAGYDTEHGPSATLL